MNFKNIPSFDKQCKKLSKKYYSIDSDLEQFKKIIKKFPKGSGQHSHILKQKKGIFIIKSRFSCRTTKSKNFRIIYAYHENLNEIKIIEFIEIYAKNQKENHDFALVDAYFKATFF